MFGGTRGTNNALTNVYNPSVQTFMAAGFTQPVLNGFGRRSNSTQIRIAKNDMKVADSVFRQQVISTLGTILNEYWDYLSFKENVRVKQEGLAFSQKLLGDNKKQVEIGTLAPIEVVRAESEVATDQQALIVAQTNLQQQGELIKTALARQVDPELAAAQIDAVDKLPEPRPDDIPPLEEALNKAFANRPEIEQTQLKFKDQDLTLHRRAAEWPAPFLERFWHFDHLWPFRRSTDLSCGDHALRQQLRVSQHRGFSHRHIQKWSSRSSRPDVPGRLPQLFFRPQSFHSHSQSASSGRCCPRLAGAAAA